uniref:GPS domain-containing protein n=1 Tax=Strongyloides venezuelensis TaxID=75913 RepID=A0A0K0FKL8_STRVS
MLRINNEYAEKSCKIKYQTMEKVILLDIKNNLTEKAVLRVISYRKLFCYDNGISFKLNMRTYFTNVSINDFYEKGLADNEFLITLSTPANILCLANYSNSVSLEIIIHIYDLYESYIFSESEFLNTQCFKNTLEMIKNVCHAIKKDIDKGFFDTLFNIREINEQICNQIINNDVIENIYAELLIKLKEDNDKSKSLLVTTNLLHYINVLQQFTNTKIFDILNKIELKKLECSNNSKKVKKRHKRNTNIPEPTMIVGNLSESAANTILVAYDVLLNKNQDIADVYLENINDIIKIFCNDTNVGEEKKATGGLYTFIQTQIVMPNNDSNINKNMTMAGSDKFMLNLDEQFNNLLFQYHCGESLSNMCNKVCIGTSLIGIGGLEVNVYFRQKLFSKNNLLASYNNLVSELRHVYIIDPTSGLFLNIPPYTIWNVQVPLHNYSSNNYYSCMLYLTNSWDTYNSCTTSDYGYLIKNSTKSRINCTCNGNGIIGVFQVPPPKPQPYPIYEEILLSFKLSSPIKCDPIKLSKFFSYLSSLTSISSNRFIRQQCTTNKMNDTISIILRPLMKDNDQSNSYIIQNIERLINSPDGIEFSDKIKILSLIPNVIKRNLTGDGNSRQVRITIEKNFSEIIFNETLIIGMWTKDISDSLGMSQYRIKNPQLFQGIIIQFTITVPFEGEISLIGQILSAEELSQILLEQTKYGELILKDLRDQVLPVKEMKQNDITELVVLHQATSQLVILGSVVGGLLLLSIFVIMALVMIKVRTDQWIAATSNNNVVTINLNNINRTTVRPSSQTIFVDQNSTV